MPHLFNPDHVVSAPPRATYLAVTSEGVIDVGNFLLAFVKQIQSEWPESSGDICIIRALSLEECEGERVVAVLSPMASGGLSVRWIS
jgi:hypothetical protein